ncbi:MAG: DEAD/DEAH box helicase [Prevotella sp.]
MTKDKRILQTKDGTTDTSGVTSASADGVTDTFPGETAADFFSRLVTVCTLIDDVRKRYVTLSGIFRRAVDTRLADCPLQFNGLFAKTDYIAKNIIRDEKLARRVNATRRNLNELTVADDGTLSKTFFFDLRNVCLFIAAMFDDAAIPSALTALFPDGDADRNWHRIDNKCLRVVVDSLDGSYIMVTDEVENGNLKVAYGRENQYLYRNEHCDWDYLEGLLASGTVLNLLRVRMEDGVCKPELIIVEPDILVDVSAVTRCFEPYSDSVRVHLLNKIRPHTTTASILLGNLAGQFLDETIKQSDVPLNDSINAFFKKNALLFADCKELQDKRERRLFCTEAKRQKENITRLIGSDLPKVTGNAGPDEMVLEPSFFCEALGLQGRLDMLRDDKDGVLIVEQKSGKADYDGTGGFDIPKIKMQHAMQLLLYRAIFRYGFGRPMMQLNNFMLLYSKYNKGLVAVPNVEEWTTRAIAMRNEIAASELAFAEKGMDMLADFTPETLNTKGLQGRLWDNFISLQLDMLLRPMKEATALERKYVFRLLRFVAKEHLLSRVGSRRSNDSGFASAWLDSPEDKMAAGNIFMGMCLQLPDGDERTPVETLRLTFAADNATIEASNFRVGDIVVFYPYSAGEKPDVCAGMVFRATLTGMDDGAIGLQMRNTQMTRKLFARYAGCLWAVEHDFMESSYSSLYRGIYSFFSALGQRKSLLLLGREPLVDESLQPQGTYGAFDTVVRRAVQAREFFIVIGPPGTGKTSFAMLNILKEELLDAANSVLLLSYTNRAVDEMCSKLMAEGIDFVRLGSGTGCPDDMRDKMLGMRIENECSGLDDVKRFVASARVVCSTVSTANGNIDLFNGKHFSLAIIDEASQILEPHLLALLSANDNTRNAIDRIVLIGDHKQLPAVVLQSREESRVDDAGLQAIGLTDCGNSFFERMLAHFRRPDGSYDERYVYMLTRQGRMHRDISQMANTWFYNNMLHTVPLAHQERPLPEKADTTDGIDRLLATHRVAFVASPLPEEGTNDKVNRTEAGMIAATLARIYNKEKNVFDPDRTVGVIVPYRSQIATVRTAIERYGIDALRYITIDTVERYQGSQRKYIIYGFTIRYRYQMQFLTANVFLENGLPIDRKLNVALTRATEYMYMFGNPRLLRENTVFRKLTDMMRAQNAYFDVAPDDFCAGRF